MTKNIIDINIFEQDKTKNTNKNIDIEKNKLKIVQANGYKEIEEYERMVENFIKEVRQLALFRKLMDDIMSEQFRFFLISEFLEALIKPLFEGNMPPFLSEEDFLAMRNDIYTDLISKYVKNDFKDLPF